MNALALALALPLALAYIDIHDIAIAIGHSLFVLDLSQSVGGHFYFYWISG